MTTVDLDINKIRDVVDKEGGCMAWGGAIRLSPADDIIIRVERSLDLDPEGQMVASVLSNHLLVQPISSLTSQLCPDCQNTF